jgi:hypothetical protein
MLTILISALVGLGLGLGLFFGDLAHWGWCLLWGLLGFGACQAGAGLLLRRRIKRLMDGVQGMLATGQKRLQAKVNQWQLRPPGSLKQAQIEMEREQRGFLQQALAQTTAFDPYYRWSPLLKRQVNTLKMQLYYQMKNFAEVDRLMPTCLFLDPMTAAMRLARLYVRKEEGLDKFFERQVARLRYGQGALLYALYAWIAVQRKDIDLAHQTLVRAAAKMENETIKRNLEHLSNNRPRQFSNAGLGDEWYALGLEEPRMKTQRPRGSGRPF